VVVDLVYIHLLIIQDQVVDLVDLMQEQEVEVPWIIPLLVMH
jgi:hypothetical protein